MVGDGAPLGEQTTTCGCCLGRAVSYGLLPQVGKLIVTLIQ